MKAFLAVLVLASTLVISVSAHASVKCEILNVVTKKPITITGRTKSEVIEKGSDACFEMYNDLEIARHGHNLKNDDAGVMVANTCTNICG